MALYESVDLKFNDIGDFEVDESGDLSDTSLDLLLSIRQEIRDRSKSEEDDWRHHPSIGANLDRFIGSPNTRETAQEIDTSIGMALTNDGLIVGNDLTIKTIPISIYRTLTRVSLQTGTLEAIVQLAFDWNEKGVLDINIAKGDE